MRATDAWQLRGPLPQTTTTMPASDAHGRALAQMLGGERQPVTEQMSCFARERGWFVLEHDAEPSNDLMSWMAARCGVGHAHPQLLMSRVAGKGIAVFDASRDRADIVAAAAAASDTADFGIAVVDDGKRSFLAITVARRRVTLDPVAMLAKDSKIVVSGESPTPIGWVTGYSTLGDDRFGECTPLPPERSGPRAFALACPVDGRDRGASIEIALAPAGAVLGDMVLSVWASPDGSLTDAWTARRIPVPVLGKERTALAWLTAINSVRERAGLAAWSHAAAQSELVSGLLPHMAAVRDDPAKRDAIVLGMLAGWKVDGTIRNGDMRLSMVPSDVPFDRAIGAAMASPSFRAGALAKDTATAALAVFEPGSSNVGQLALVGYSLFQARDYRAEEERFLDELDADRISRGLPTVERVGGPKDRELLDAAATRVRKGESAPMEEMKGLLDHFSRATGQTMRGAVFTTLTLEGYRPSFDGVLANATNVVAVVKIADWRPAGSAWGQHVVYVVFAVPGESGP
ncbi:MAG: hypothetical protein IAG13_00580 [Deltaproteobacteria bacterium]|nr:hypothetical protein [Nannocystaceae bacterium]